jgi:hypothetical protein
MKSPRYIVYTDKKPKIHCIYRWKVQDTLYIQSECNLIWAIWWDPILKLQRKSEDVAQKMSTLLPHPGSGFTPYYYTPMSTQRTLLGYNPNASKPEALDKLYPGFHSLTTQKEDCWGCQPWRLLWGTREAREAIPQMGRLCQPLRAPGATGMDTLTLSHWSYL